MLAGYDTEALPRIESLIAEIGEEGLFRGEAEHFPNIASTLYRRFKCVLGSKATAHSIQVQLAHFAVKHFGSELEQYKRDTGELDRWSGGYDPTKFSEDGVRVWSMMQHLGAATNLIDFSTDPKVALFFACAGSVEVDGRVLILVKDHDYDLISAEWPANRIQAQRSRFVWSPEGYVAADKVRVVNVPQELKIPALKWLKRQAPPVSHSTMYEDMPGYVSQSAMYEDALCEYLVHFQQADDSVESLRRLADAGEDGTACLQTFLDAAGKMETLAMRVPWFTWAHWQLGRMFMAANQLDAAMHAYEEAWDWCTDHDPSVDEKVRILVDLGLTYERLGKSEGARWAYERAKSMDQTLAENLIQDWHKRLGL